MYWKTPVIILFQLTILRLTESFRSKVVNFPRCSYKCENPKKQDVVNTKKIEDFYWRDFYGVVPPDAFQIGNNNQNPQTYVGMVFDPSNNGTFVTTIVEGQDYVYGVLDDKVSKITDQIQILCTMEPERMIWKALSNVNQADGYLVIQGSVHYKGLIDRMNPNYIRHYVVKTSEKNVVYAGYSTGLNTSMTYALMNGTPKKTVQFEWLLFEEEPKKEYKNTQSKPFFNYNYNINFNSGSFIPQYHNRINIGSCSLVCTNQGKNSTSKEEQFDKRSKNAMVYYWKPVNVDNRKDALHVGKKVQDNNTLYIAQAYIPLNWYDVGEAEEGLVLISTYGVTDVQLEDFQFLSSVSQERLEWINTTTNTFGQLDKTTLVPGGKLDNNTETFVGRAYFINDYKPGSIRSYRHGRFCYSLYGAFQEFQVLSIKDDTS